MHDPPRNMNGLWKGEDLFHHLCNRSTEPENAVHYVSVRLRTVHGNDALNAVVTDSRVAEWTYKRERKKEHGADVCQSNAQWTDF